MEQDLGLETFPGECLPFGELEKSAFIIVSYC